MNLSIILSKKRKPLTGVRGFASGLTELNRGLFKMKHVISIFAQPKNCSVVNNRFSDRDIFPVEKA